MGLEQIARNKEVYLGWLKKDQAEEEENRVWCFRSQGKQSILKFREYSIMLNAAESAREVLMLWIWFSSSKDVDDLVKSNLLNDGKNQIVLSEGV